MGHFYVWHSQVGGVFLCVCVFFFNVFYIIVFFILHYYFNTEVMQILNQSQLQPALCIYVSLGGIRFESC